MTASRSGGVEVLDYDDAWSAGFRSYESQIRSVLGAAAVRIEHIGSTSVVGLAAKPVIDIQVSVAALGDLESYKPGLEQLGWLHRPHPENEEPREFFRPPGPRVVHVHVVESGSDVEREYLLHRDFLRANSDVAGAYGELKKRLAHDLHDDRQDYQWAKNPFLQEMRVQAEAWAAGVGWIP